MTLTPAFRNVLKATILPFLAAALPLAAQTSLTGAGATFPAPIYTKWFAEYQSVGNVQINYRKRFGRGNQGDHGRHGRFRRERYAADGRTDQDLQGAQRRDEHSAVPDRAGGCGSQLQRAGRDGRSEVHRESAGGDLPRKHQEVERSGDCEGESGCEAAGR